LSKKLSRLYAQKGYLAVLSMFGLDEILTKQDDPNLWAAVLAKHWPAPNEPDMLFEGLRFGISQEISHREDGTGDKEWNRSGMDPIEVWCFKSLGNGGLFVVECAPETHISFFSSIINSDSGVSGSQTLPSVKTFIDIQRPSQGLTKALVHVGTSIPPNMGRGETRRWVREEDGMWVETNEIVFHWIS